MRVLITGASSFTGCWFTQALVRAGFAVTASFRQELTAYSGLRLRRVQLAAAAAQQSRYGQRFGDDGFLAEVAAGSYDLLCCHGAEVGDYKSPQFDADAAVAGNTRRLPEVLAAFRAAGGKAVLLTGSVFESDEGQGDLPLRAFSPYGQSKARTWVIFRDEAQRQGVPLGKFVIANPFGPLEEARFTSFLARSWLSGQTPPIKTPDYVRDNIPVDLLARVYARFAAALLQLPPASPCRRCNPSFYVEPVGQFVERFAVALAPRLGVPCRYQCQEQHEFAEPRVRYNTQKIAAADYAFDEAAAWDDLAKYYREAFTASNRQ